MNKAELADRLAEQLGIPRPDSLSMLNTVLDCITAAIADGDQVRLSGFGCFEPKQLKQRGAPFGAAPSSSMSVAFRPGVKLLEAASKASEPRPEIK